MQRLPLPPHATGLDGFVGRKGALAIADYDHTAVFMSDADGTWIWPNASSSASKLRSLGGLQFSSSNELWITDPDDSRIHVFDETLQLLRSVSTSVPLRSVSPVRLGDGFLGNSDRAGELVGVFSASGAQIASIPLPVDLRTKHPATLERFLARVNDSLTTVQFRWYPRLIAVRNSGEIQYNIGVADVEPQLLQIPLGGRGSFALRIAPSEREKCVAIAVKGDTLLMLKGGSDSSLFARRIVRFEVRSGKLIDSSVVPTPLSRLAATSRGVFGLVDNENGYALSKIRWK